MSRREPMTLCLDLTAEEARELREFTAEMMERQIRNNASNINNRDGNGGHIPNLILDGIVSKLFRAAHGIQRRPAPVQATQDIQDPELDAERWDGLS
jgi:hypothetical protein